MNSLRHGALRAAAVVGLSIGAVPAQTLSLATSPLFLGTTVKPNVLVVYDNSQSMDGTMSGKLIAGDCNGSVACNGERTRGNIARAALRDTITTYRNAFQWGLASFGLSGAADYYITYVYFLGPAASAVWPAYTNDCVGGHSASVSATAGKPVSCVTNPEPGNGFNFITYDVNSDESRINDVFYYNDQGPQMYGVGASGNSYYAYKSHNSNAGAGWATNNFSGTPGTSSWTFTPTDAGFFPKASDYPRLFLTKRAWGYNANITGKGVVNQPVALDSTSQYNSLMAWLAPETGSNTGELKNAAVFTPLAGTLDTVKSYFTGGSSPIGALSCQRNFVLLATDGIPTGKTDGSMYSVAETTNTQIAGTPNYSFGTAANDVFSRVTALRSISYNGKPYDVQTYVIGMGDTFNPATDAKGAIPALDRMALLGGTDAAFKASDPTALADAFRAISVDIISRTAAASSVSLNSGSWNTGAKVYQGRFSSGDWSGQLLSFPLGSNGTPSATADWDAAQRVSAQHWSSGRQIMTYKPSAGLGARGVPFRWPANAAAPGGGEIDLGLVTVLNKAASGTVDNFGAQRLEFLRGNRAREDGICSGCAAPVFRSRPVSVLGDIVNSAPMYVGGATGDFRDTMQSARYSSYATTRGSQSPVIYVGANDGMLHAFSASNGSELFAYVPWAVRNRLSNLSNLPYTHQYTVDGSPSVGDVYYGSGWKTVLVSGMNAGAPGLFALDVSNPANFIEANAAQVVRWEIGDSDADVGYIFGRPLLVKMRDGRWRAIVGNGYNSTNGHAVLLMVDVETGAVTRIDTGSGSAGTPNGLSTVAVVSSTDNGVADLVFAGDLYGNLWKFDISATSAAGWKVAYGTGASPLPLFTAPSGQAITARPDVTIFPKGGYLVAVGTGRYVDIGDNAAGATQAIYGIWDNGAPVALANLQTQSIVGTGTGGSGSSYRFSTHAVGPATDTAVTGDNAISLADYYANKKGWKLNLPSSGERVVTEAAIRNGRLVVSSLIPSTAVCSYGGDGWIIDVDVVTGNRTAALDTNGDGVINNGDYIGGTMVSGVQVGAVPAAATIMRGSGDQRALEFKMINTSSGSIVRVPEAGNPARSRRSAWEQLQ